MAGMRVDEAELVALEANVVLPMVRRPHGGEWEYVLWTQPGHVVLGPGAHPRQAETTSGE